MIKDPEFKLSPHFKFKELIKSTTAQRLGIDNGYYVTEEILENAVTVAENILEPVRKRFGSISPNSWFRSEQLEYAICTQSFFRGLQRQGIEGVTPDSHKIWASLFALPDEYAEHWKAYFTRKQHPKGMAVDFEKTGVSNQMLFEWCRDNLQFDQLILEFYKPELGDNSGWVHGSYNKKGVNRNQLLRY